MSAGAGPGARRRLGRSAVQIDALSLGLVPLGNLYREVSDDQAQAVLQAWWDAGLRSFDVAPVYGFGIAERRLGAFLADKPRADTYISTKVGRLLVSGAPPDPEMAPGGVPFFQRTPPGVNPVRDYSADGIRCSIDDSLRRLGIDRLDTVYIHDPDEFVDEAINEAYPTLVRLRDEGVVGAIGVGVTTLDTPVRIARAVDLDVVMLAGRYTLLEQEALDQLLPVLEERRVSVVLGGVLNSGFMADPRLGAMYDYRPTTDRRLVDRALRIRDICTRHGVALLAAAIQLASAHPQVASVVVGAGRPDHARDLITAFSQHVPRRMWDELKAGGLIRIDVPTDGPFAMGPTVQRA